ncbi:Putative glycosyltransferase EpsD [Parageobacillus caldoxylosilyticus]|uniref:glycosyltransferase family 4 protein n=1 Tax=Saccharococcus caldoxylosilyticus TaxID=81408 RepID=UPI001C4DF1CF|nr:glycosyltransferase family 4 protein [Parageobacillus caldoxylosilyticus]QXJ38641.1 Putative glycosyltransferase EpsD [Parageobacillus caldoxylosilyticus]
MKKKVLFSATVDIHINMFHIPYLKFFKELGWEVHVAAAGNMEIPYCDVKFNIPFKRSPFKLSNIIAYFQLKRCIDENKYDIIHCHTPVGGVLTRLASRKARRNGTKVLYTAHGFHFYEGAPLLNWIIYYPIEKCLARYTDCLITINEEDYKTALKGNFKAKSIERINGVGVDLSRFKPVDETTKRALRVKHSLNPNDFILVYAAELNSNKNQQLLIEIVAKLKKQIPNIRLLLAGSGPLEKKYITLVKKYGLEKHVNLLGYRNDVDELYQLSDIGVASSIREGFGINLVEAMACGKPVVATKNRGHREIVLDGENGFLINPDSPEEGIQAILSIYKSQDIRQKMGEVSLERSKIFSVENAGIGLKQIYRKYI